MKYSGLERCTTVVYFNAHQLWNKSEKIYILVEAILLCVLSITVLCVGHIDYVIYRPCCPNCCLNCMREPVLSVGTTCFYKNADTKME